MTRIIADRRLFADANWTRLLEDGDLDAAFLVAGGAGREIPLWIVERLNLTISKKGKVVKAKPEIKDVKKPRTKDVPSPDESKKESGSGVTVSKLKG